MSGIKDFGGFGTEDTESGTEDFESSTAGGNGHTDDSTPRDDHSDDVGWDQVTDVKAIEGVGKEPTDDPEKNEDKGTGVDKDKPAPKAKEPEKKGDDDGKDDDDDAGDKGDDLPEGVKRRVSRAQRQRDQAREEAEALRKENEELRAAQAKSKADDTAPPKAEDFDDYEDYLQAKKDHEAKPKPKAEDKPADDAKPKPDAELVGAVKEIEASLMDAGHGDLFKQVVAKADIDVTRDMAIAIADLDNPESVLQAFLDDPAKSKAIADLKTPTARLKALLKLDVPYVKPDAKKGDEAKDAAKAKPTPKGSDAPDPIDETNGNAQGEAGYDGLSFSEFEKRRNSEERASKDFW